MRTVNGFIAVSAVAWVCCTAYVVETRASAQAQPAGKSSSLHLYTEAQAKRGQQAVEKDCATCHGEDLDSGQGNLNLSSDRFLYQWGIVSLGDIAAVARAF